MRKRYENRRQIKQKELKKHLDFIEEQIYHHLPHTINSTSRSIPYEDLFSDCTRSTPWFSQFPDDFQNFPTFPDIEPINWNNIPEYIDPSSGELQQLRAKRKRQQLESLILLIENEIQFYLSNNITPTIIDFGAGSGHLGLIIAYRNPLIRVILLERKEYSVMVAQERIQQCNLSNITIDQSDILDIMNNSFQFHIGISLHSCGQLTDLILQLCSQVHASFILTPCCYGQVANPPPILNPITNQMRPIIPRLQFFSFSNTSSTNTSTPDETIFPLIISNADYSNSFPDEIIQQSSFTSQDIEKNSQSFLLAKRCMRIIDFDRLIHTCTSMIMNPSHHHGHQMNNSLESSSLYEGHYIFRMTSLSPLSCSPKNNVIIGRYLNHSNNSRPPPPQQQHQQEQQQQEEEEEEENREVLLV